MENCSKCQGTGKGAALSQNPRGYSMWYCDCEKGIEVKEWEKENKGGDIYWKDPMARNAIAY